MSAKLISACKLLDDDRLRSTAAPQEQPLQNAEHPQQAGKLSPVGCCCRVLHFLAEVGGVPHSLMRFLLSDSTCSARIPRVLIFRMKYRASLTALVSM